MKFFIFFILIIIFSSCGISNKSLNNEIPLLETDSKQNISEVKIIKSESLELESVTEELVELILVVSVESKNKLVSELSKLEYILRDNSKFSNFKKGGLENYFDISFEQMEGIIKEATTYIGTRHKMGGLTHNGIDCSGLLYVSFNSQNIKGTPRTAESFARFGVVIINTDNLKRGDLVFFTNTYSTSKFITHIGICVGNGKFIHTSSSKGVLVSHLDSSKYLKDKFIFGTRVVN